MEANPNPFWPYIDRVATSLAEISERVVFTGGTTVPFYHQVGGAEFRPTDDVDCVLEVVTPGEYPTVGARLRQLGFQPDPNSSVICRWKRLTDRLSQYGKRRSKKLPMIWNVGPSKPPSTAAMMAKQSMPPDSAANGIRSRSS